MPTILLALGDDVEGNLISIDLDTMKLITGLFQLDGHRTEMREREKENYGNRDSLNKRDRDRGRSAALQLSGDELSAR